MKNERPQFPLPLVVLVIHVSDPLFDGVAMLVKENVAMLVKKLDAGFVSPVQYLMLKSSIHVFCKKFSLKMSCQLNCVIKKKICNVMILILRTIQ